MAKGLLKRGYTLALNVSSISAGGRCQAHCLIFSHWSAMHLKVKWGELPKKTEPAIRPFAGQRPEGQPAQNWVGMLTGEAVIFWIWLKQTWAIQ
jgi:hypothetical protein